MNNNYAKAFIGRGMAFGGFGPIIAGIVYLILHFTLKDFSLSGMEVFTAVISTYLLAFIHAGASVFNQIEHWSVGKSLFCHLGSLYIAYVLCYVINDWIPFDPVVILIFTAIFVGAYFVIWLTVMLCIKAVERKLNARLR